MFIKNKNKFVAVRLFRKVEKGSLLIECILSVWMLLFTFILLHFYFQGVSKEEELLETSMVNTQWELFVEALQMELYIANFSDVTVRSKKLYFTNENHEKVSYELSGGRVRRKVNGTGNEIVLLGVKRLSFQVNDTQNKIYIETEFEGGQVEREWMIYQI